MGSIQPEHFTNAVLELLDETFDNVQGFYLDKNTSLFETLADISAEKASIPVGGRCATLAAQVKHIAFYLDVLEKAIQDIEMTNVDWGEIWRTVDQVTEAEWQAIQAELRASYKRIQTLVKTMPAWKEDEINGAVSVIVHTAYHLGEVRQALCILQD